MKTDDELVEEAREENEESFAELIRRHSGASCQVAVSMLRDPQEAEDQAQNAYWKAHRSIGRFEGETRFSTWITRIVINRGLIWRRQQRRARLPYVDDIRIGESRATLEFPDGAKTPGANCAAWRYCGPAGMDEWTPRR